MNGSFSLNDMSCVFWNFLNERSTAIATYIDYSYNKLDSSLNWTIFWLLL